MLFSEKKQENCKKKGVMAINEIKYKNSDD